MVTKNKNSRSRCRKNSSGGFSLIEVAIALIVIGLLMSAVLQTYNMYAVEQVRLESRSKVETVKTALYRYMYRYGRYPLPAPRNAAMGSATFGREVTGPVTTLCSSGAAAAGDVCVTTIGSADTSADVDAAPDPVLIGDVPFATLGIRYDNTLDPWGGKFTYAVTGNMTSMGSSDNWGAIEVLDKDGNNAFSVGEQRAHYFLTSAGPDRKGAFGVGGTEIAACTATSGTDQENCDRDGTFRSNQDLSSVEKLTQIFDGNNASHFDDFVYYTDSTDAGIWTRLTATTPGQIDIANTNAQNTKIGAFPTSAPATCATECTPICASAKAACDFSCGGNAACLASCAAAKTNCDSSCLATNCKSLPRTKVDVEGSVRANQVNTNRLCYDNSPTGCTSNLAVPIPYGMFAPRTVGGIPTTGAGTTPVGNSAIAPSSTNIFRNNGGGILCRSNMAMRGMGTGEELCAYTTYFSSAGTLGTSSCGSGYYAKGINSDGTFCCSDAASCY
ncbi:MAG: hypothetical protein AUJ12_02260 [Alphaproteobacteria bacterium CG1_02_46_17]|nr:MAG: hypothetical protein AUJ12_02260 [Alphaproteobacteria bacterium CG1_02_46_17]